MATFEEDIMQDAREDALVIDYIKSHLPQELQGRFIDDELYYIHDVLGEFVVGLLEKAGDSDDVEIDMEAAAAYVVRQAHKDGIGDLEADDVRWVLEADLDYGDSLGE